MERNDMAHMTDIAPLDGSGSFQAYVAEPAGKPRGAIIVIQEIFGVNPGIRQMCDGWAAEGYLALAPDLFWRMEPGVQLDADNERSEEHTSELQSLMRISYAVFCLKKKNTNTKTSQYNT